MMTVRVRRKEGAKGATNNGYMRGLNTSAAATGIQDGCCKLAATWASEAGHVRRLTGNTVAIN